MIEFALIMFNPFKKSESGNIFEAFNISLPLVLAMAANAINQFIDRIFLARFSDEAIQGSLPGGILSWLFICFIIAVASYSGTFVAQFWGAGAKRDAARAFGQGLRLTLYACPLFIITIPLGHLLFNLAGHAPAVMQAEKNYYDILMLGGIFITAQAVISGFFTGQGRTRIVCLASVIGTVANILLDRIMIFGCCGFPALGIVGAGIATVIASVIATTILAIVALRDPLLRGKRFFAAFKYKRDLLFRIIQYGTPSGLHQFLDVLTFTVFVMMTGRLDAMSFAVSNIVFTINHLSFAPLLGFQQASTVLVGRYQGEGNSKAAERAGWSCTIIGVLYVTIFAIFALSCSDWTMELFRSSDSAFEQEAFRKLGQTLIIILISWGFFDAIDLILGGGLKGAGDTKFVMTSQISISLILWMPAVFLIMIYNPSIVALWLTMPLYCGMLFIVILWRWMSGKWKKLRLVDDLIETN